MKYIYAVVFIMAIFPHSAIGNDTWSVITYSESGQPLNSEVFFEVSSEGKEAAIFKAMTACEMHAKNKDVHDYKCDVVGTCSEPGWLSIASCVKAGGVAKISCKQSTAEMAVASAKKMCGSQTCATLFTYEIMNEKGKKKFANR